MASAGCFAIFGRAAALSCSLFPANGNCAREQTGEYVGNISYSCKKVYKLFVANG